MRTIIYLFCSHATYAGYVIGFSVTLGLMILGCIVSNLVCFVCQRVSSQRTQKAEHSKWVEDFKRNTFRSPPAYSFGIFLFDCFASIAADFRTRWSGPWIMIIHGGLH